MERMEESDIGRGRNKKVDSGFIEYCIWSEIYMGCNLFLLLEKILF